MTMHRAWNCGISVLANPCSTNAYSLLLRHGSHGALDPVFEAFALLRMRAAGTNC